MWFGAHCYHIFAFKNVVDSKEEGELKRVTFARSPIMSTYLLAFIVGEFDFVEEKDANGLLVRVYTPVGKAEQGRFALEVRTIVYALSRFAQLCVYVWCVCMCGVCACVCVSLLMHFCVVVV